MAWTDPASHVYVTGEVVTAATLNTYVRLNLQALYDAPFCRAFTSVNVSIPNGVDTAVALNSESEDNDAIHSTSTNTSRLTPPTVGGYVIVGYLWWAGSAGGNQRAAWLRLSGGTTRLGQNDTPRNGAIATAVTVPAMYRFTTGSYVEIMAYQDSGAALNVTTAILAMVKVSNAL